MKRSLCHSDPYLMNLMDRLYIRLERMGLAKKCRFLVPPSFNVRRLHCNRGDGFEQLCPMYEGKTHMCCFKEGKMELKFKEVRRYEVDYDDLDRFINELFFDGKNKFEFAASEEANNDTSYTFNVDGEVDEYDKKKIADRSLMYMARAYLCEACRTGKIPAGKYLVKVCW